MSLQGVTTTLLSCGWNIWNGARILVPNNPTASVLTSLAIGTLVTAGGISAAYAQLGDRHFLKMMHKGLLVAEYGTALALVFKGGPPVFVGGYATAVGMILTIIGIQKLLGGPQVIHFDFPGVGGADRPIISPDSEPTAFELKTR